MKIVLVTSSVTAIPDNYYELFSKLVQKYPHEIKGFFLIKNANWHLLKIILALRLVGAKNLSRTLLKNWMRLVRGARQELFKQHKIPVFETTDINRPEIVEWIKKNEIDLVINIRTRCFYKNSILNAPKIACINIHHGLLPENRGVMCDLYALSQNRPAGYSIHVMTSKLDAGEILYKKNVSEIGEKDYVAYLKKTGLHEFEGLCAVIESIRKFGLKGEPNTSKDIVFSKNPDRKMIREFIKKGMSL